MPTTAQKLHRVLARVFPGCVMQAQAVAFNMFLAFFPMLLFALGLLASSESLQGTVKELPERLSLILPPGSKRVVFEYLVRSSGHPWRWVTLGLGGTLLAGTQVMIGLMDGFRVVAGRAERPPFFNRQSRALVLLSITLVPWMAAVTLTVFGKQFRASLIHEVGLPQLIQGLGALVYVGLVLLLGMGVLVVVYHFSRFGRGGWRNLFPGAMVATVLWWIVDVGFGWYFRHMPYRVVYGGLAAAIGLLLWMYMTAIVVFIGAAYNVESARGASGRA